VTALRVVGASLRRASRFEPLRSAVLAAGVAAFVLSVVSLAITTATYTGWDSRAEERAGRMAALFPDEEPRALWRHGFDLVDGRQVDVVYLAPLVEEPPVPPGLTRWPRAGEAFLSPAVAEALGASVGDQTRHGTMIGLVDRDGLVERGEGLVYVGAEGRLAPESAELITGFGSDRFEQPRAIADRRPLATFLGVQIALLVVPATWLLFTGIRIGAVQRARRVRIVTTLGMRPRQVRALLWGESRSPWGLGALVALLCTALLLVVDVALPGASLAVDAQDVRSGGVLVVVAFVAALALSAWACSSRVGLKAERRRDRRRSSSGPSWLARTLAVARVARGGLSLVLAAITVIGQNIAVGEGRVDLVPMIALVGTTLTLAALPADAVVWIELYARRRRDVAWRAGDAAGLTGAAQLLSRPRPAARFGATAAIIVVIVTVTSGLLTTLGQDAAQALAVQRHLGGSVATIQTFRQAGAESRELTLDALRRDYVVAAIQPDGEGMSVVAPRGEDVETFVPDGRPPAWLAYVAGTEVGHRVDEIEDGPEATVLVTRRDGSSIDMEELRDQLGSLSVPMWQAELPGEGFVVGTASSLHQMRWLTWFGSIGLVLTLVALWSNYSNELLRAVRSLLAIQMLAPSDAFVKRVLAARIVAPVAVAVVGGGVLALILSIPPVPGETTNLPYGIVLACVLASFVTGVIAWSVTWRACVRGARSMSLGVPEE
jgi:hypothetical protein